LLLFNFYKFVRPARCDTETLLSEAAREDGTKARREQTRKQHESKEEDNDNIYYWAAPVVRTNNQVCVIMSSSTAPADGWIEELRQASQEAKASPPTAANQLRLARATCKLRQWSKCAKAASKGLSLHPSAEEKLQLKICNNLAEEAMRSQSQSLLYTWSEFKEVYRPMFASGKGDINNTTTSDSLYANLSVLQHAASIGDVPLLESIVSLGAALDLPVSTKELPDRLNFPPGATALVIVCTTLAASEKNAVLFVDQPHMQQRLEEAAIRLVKLGADCDAKLLRPARRSYNSAQRSTENIYRRHGLFGKTARELASISKMSRLVNVMNEWAGSLEVAIAKVQCRCGSRLPWKECHAGRQVGQASHFIYAKDGRTPPGHKIIWRYPPTARCPCHKGSSAKTHFQCCWESSLPNYIDDCTGNEQFAQFNVDPAMATEMLNPLDARADRADLLISKIGRLLTNEELERIDRVMALGEGQEGFVEVVLRQGPKTKMTAWDHNVAAGCYDRLEVPLLWVDVHWHIEESYLLLQANAWNEALAKYCDDMGLTGTEREEVTKLHQASVYAPCANLGCNNIETMVKEYQKCSNCKRVGYVAYANIALLVMETKTHTSFSCLNRYCSRECQVADWKDHKKKCIGSCSPDHDKNIQNADGCTILVNDDGTLTIMGPGHKHE